MVYCWPCILFSNDRVGFCDTHRMKQRLEEHKRKSSHSDHYSSWKSLKNGSSQTIDCALSEARKRQLKEKYELIDKARTTLMEYIDVAAFLAKQGSAFRGHREDDDASNQGNYLEWLQIRAKRSPLLYEQMNHNNTMYCVLFFFPSTYSVESTESRAVLARPP